MNHRGGQRTHPAWGRWRSRTKVRAARLINGVGAAATAAAGHHRDSHVPDVRRGPMMGP